MKRQTLAILALTLAGSLLATGCYTRRAVVLPPTGPVVVRTAPPAPRVEVRGVAPSANHVWVDGYWVHADQRWTWVPGHWEVRPRANAAWVPGSWAQTSTGWAWTPGHWEY